MEAHIQNGGSRNTGGSVPYVDLDHDGEVNVNWYNLSGADARYGVRREVFLQIPITLLLGFVVMP